jgi:hypothetical protein
MPTTPGEGGAARETCRDCFWKNLMELWAHTCCQWRRLGEGALGLLASHSLGVLGTWAGSNEEREHHISEQKLVSVWLDQAASWGFTTRQFELRGLQ